LDVPQSTQKSNGSRLVEDTALTVAIGGLSGGKRESKL
jgi:primary-amine oxidase